MASSSSSDDEQAFNIPSDVRTQVPVPASFAGNGSSARLARLYGLVGEEVNVALELINDQFSTKKGHYYGNFLSNAVEDAKKSVWRYMIEIKMILDTAGEGAFGVPRELRKAFKYLELKWPPVMTDDDDQAA